MQRVINRRRLTVEPLDADPWHGGPAPAPAWVPVARLGGARCGVLIWHRQTGALAASDGRSLQSVPDGKVRTALAAAGIALPARA